MKKYLSPLKLKDYLTLTGLVIIGFGWILIDQVFLSETYQRFSAFCIFIFVLFYLQFVINKPTNVIHYCNSIALIIISFVVIVSLLIDVIIRNNFSIKLIMIWIISGLLPYLTGFVYMRTKKK
jgi:hypothetical protein